MGEPLKFSYNVEIDELVIEGIRYSGDLFRGLGLATEPGTCIRIVERRDGQIRIEKCWYHLAMRQRYGDIVKRR